MGHAGPNVAWGNCFGCLCLKMALNPTFIPNGGGAKGTENRTLRKKTRKDLRIRCVTSSIDRERAYNLIHDRTVPEIPNIDDRHLVSIMVYCIEGSRVVYEAQNSDLLTTNSHGSK